MKSEENKFWEKVKKTSTCWKWTGWVRNKYGYFNNKKNKLSAHRFSYELHKGKIAKGLCVCHLCDNPLCVNPAHLWLGTNQDNIKDRDLKGRQSKGSNHWFSKLNKDSKQARLKLSEQRKGKKNPFYGKKHSPEVIEKIRKSLTGREKTEETRNKLSKALKGRIFSKEWKQKISRANKGKFISDEQRRKISKALKGRIFSKETLKKISIAQKKRWKKILL